MDRRRAVEGNGESSHEGGSEIECESSGESKKIGKNSNHNEETYTTMTTSSPTVVLCKSIAYRKPETHTYKKRRFIRSRTMSLRMIYGFPSICCRSDVNDSRGGFLSSTCIKSWKEVADTSFIIAISNTVALYTVAPMLRTLWNLPEGRCNWAAMKARVSADALTVVGKI
nr:hypothetical protein Iba_chr08eCG1130 [Ipomoea batatas]